MGMVAAGLEDLPNSLRAHFNRFVTFSARGHAAACALMAAIWAVSARWSYEYTPLGVVRELRRCGARNGSFPAATALLN